VLQRSPGRGHRPAAADTRDRRTTAADAAEGVLRVRGRATREPARGAETAAAHGPGQCAHHQGEAARVPRGDREEELTARRCFPDMRDTTASNDADLAKPLNELRSVLIPGETLEAFAVQRRVFALLHRRTLVAATSGRLVVLTRRLLGGFDVATIRWQDLEEVTLRVGIISADIAVRAGKATDLASLGAQGSQRVEFQGLRKEQAQAVYRICQAQDQAWREKRRVRELEELRARSGGFQVLSAAGAPSAGAESDAVRRLREAKQLLDAKLITDAEYEAIKAKIVSS